MDDNLTQIDEAMDNDIPNNTVNQELAAGNVVSASIEKEMEQ